MWFCRRTLFLILCLPSASLLAEAPGPPTAGPPTADPPTADPPERVHRISQEEYEATLHYWARQHPETVTLERVAESSGGMGIFLLKITNSDADDRDKQVVLITALHGGPERSGSTTALHFIEWLLSESPEAQETRRKQIVLVMPINHPEAFFQTDRFRNPANIDPYTGGGPQHWDLTRLKYTSAEQAPEVQAVLEVVDRWKPEVHADLHGTGLQEYPPERLGDRTRYQGQTMFEVTGSAYSNFALRPWDWRVTEAMVRAGEEAGFPSDRFEADAQRSLGGPAMAPLADRNWPGQANFYTAQYGYAKYHTMVTALEIGWEQSGLARLRGLLRIGNGRWQSEPELGYPVDRVQAFAGHYVTSYGRTAAARRRSRVELWQQQGGFTQAMLYPQTDGRDTYFVATSPAAASGFQKELDPFFASIAQRQDIDFESFHRFVRRGPEVQLAVAPGSLPSELPPPIQHGIGFRLRLPYQDLRVDAVMVNGQPLEQDAEHGYQSWLANGYTQVQVNLPPEVSAHQDLFLITCEYTPSEQRRIGWTPPPEVLKQLRSK
ncbi:M14 family zinc carboxypeptidase [Candidatus Laterigemmans baculatus]|uniref:M14 family zinc carboxypeptidase n=1 Tax=Candidatus Laterigemmans baculatus TaxID=2770505 RepID=UPI0013DBEDEA|nr:M14 family zinc carboxypeptidase [Candidatus Laterigemmans baculatus]